MEVFAILRDGAVVASVAFRRARSVTCIVKLGAAYPVCARAGGTGYDRASAAFEAACAKLNAGNPLSAALAAAGDGRHWTIAMRQAGYELYDIPVGF